VQLFTSRYCPKCDPDEVEEITLDYDMEEVLFRNSNNCAHEVKFHYEYDSKWWCQACGAFIRDA
jgi:hypothetical protein